MIARCRSCLCALLVVGMGVSALADNPSYEVSDFGVTKYGERARKFTLKGAGGIVLEVTDYGGRVVRLFAPDREGKARDVVVGFDDPSGWENCDFYCGSIIGRYANRIARGEFVLNGIRHRLASLNNVSGGMPCTIHGGARGWNSYVWGAEPFVKGSDVGVVLTHVSPDGDEGFPGRVEVKVTYTLTASNVWRIDYEAVPDRDTPINMTHHVYFNFKGEAGGTIEDHILTIAADTYLPTDPGQIPTGEVRSVAGTPFDFRKGMRIGEMINAPDPDLEIGLGYDHCWNLGGKGLRFAARLECPLNGRALEVWTEEPCLQLYTVNEASYRMKAKGGEHLSARCGVALETQHAPDSPNRPEWPSVIVKAGETYRSSTEFRFLVAPSIKEGGQCQ